VEKLFFSLAVFAVSVHGITLLFRGLVALVSDCPVSDPILFEFAPFFVLLEKGKKKTKITLKIQLSY
jgi:hypothetical protein